ncbi:IS110 family transposase [Chryseobacterium sp. HMWF028]|nr:IS110 family transposase [Chryseobacterium sp. HMWF028]
MDTKLSKIRDIRVDFSGKNIYLGLDVHKKNWSVTVYLEDLFFQTFHQESDAKRLFDYLDKTFPNGQYKACYEAGFCGFSIHRELTALGIECIVVNPADVPQTNKGTLSKTDASDSKRLAAAFSKGFVKGIYIPDQDTESDRQLLRYRKKIQNHLQSKRKVLKSLLHIVGIKIPVEYDKPYWTNNFVQWIRSLNPQESSLKMTLQLILDDVEILRKRLFQTNKLIRELSTQEKYAQMYDVLISTPGVGIITAMTLLTEIGNIERFECFSKFNSFIGLCPSEFSSGDMIHKGKITPRNHNAIRPLIIEASWIAIRTDPVLTLKFHELIKYKTKKRAIVIIARKLLSRIFSIWTKKLEYQKGKIK